MEGKVQEVGWVDQAKSSKPSPCRVFCIGALSITTYNPSTMEATNQWQYSDFITILPAARGQASQPNNEFIITFKKGKKTDSMRFSSDHRAAIITETMR